MSAGGRESTSGDRDRELQRLLTAAESSASPVGECLSNEQLAALAHGESTAAERNVALAHLETCADCSFDLAMLFELEPWLDDVSAALVSELEPAQSATRGRGQDLKAPRRDSRWRRLVARPWLLAAPLAAAALVLLMVRAWPGAVTRPQDGVVRSLGPAVVPEPDVTLEEQPRELVWPADPEVESYRVRVFDAAGSLLIDRSVPAAEGTLRLSEEERAQLLAGGSYFWVVDAQAAAPEGRIGPNWFHVESNG